MTIMSYEESNAWRPEIKGWSEDILPFYRRMVATAVVKGHYRLAFCVEVGVFRGRSLLFLAEELGKSRGHEATACRVWGVDPGEGLFGPGSPKNGPHLGHAYPGFEGPSHDELVANVARTERDRCGVIVDVLRVPSLAAASTFPDESVDMVFLDGDHEPAALRADIEAWTTKLVPCGILAGHDYGHYAWPGVKAVVDSLRDRERVTIERSVWWLVKPEGDLFP